MKKDKIQQTINDLVKGKTEALKIIKKLDASDTDEKMKCLDLLDKLPPLPVDDESRELKEFEETKELYKRLYTLAARTIMDILGSNHSQGIHDPAHSFNYSDPREPLMAAEKIKFLPKAYMGGPIRAAITSPYKKVNLAGVEYYEELPQELKYSNTFPDPIRKKIRILKGLST